MSFSINVIPILCTKDSRLGVFVAFSHFLFAISAFICLYALVFVDMWICGCVWLRVSLSGSRMNCYLLARILLHCRMRKLNFVVKCKLASVPWPKSTIGEALVPKVVESVLNLRKLHAPPTPVLHSIWRRIKFSSCSLKLDK